MVLIIGAEGSGKKRFAQTLGYSESDMTAELNEKPVVYNVHKFLFEDPSRVGELYAALKDKPVVICNEVGSGIIPIDGKQRLGREAAGRLCCLLAVDATAVIRLVCGIPQVIKGSI